MGEVIAKMNNSPIAIKIKNTQKLSTRKAMRAMGKLVMEKKKQTAADIKLEPPSLSTSHPPNAVPTNPQNTVKIPIAMSAVAIGTPSSFVTYSGAQKYNAPATNYI